MRGKNEKGGYAKLKLRVRKLSLPQCCKLIPGCFVERQVLSIEPSLIQNLCRGGKEQRLDLGVSDTVCESTTVLGRR